MKNKKQLCEVCGEEINGEIKILYGLLICERCRDEELKAQEEDDEDLKKYDL